MGWQERSLLIEVKNYAFLTRCYGTPFANAVEAELLERVGSLCGPRFTVKTLGGGKLGVVRLPTQAHTQEEAEACNEPAVQDVFVQGVLLGLAKWAERECGASSLALLNVNWVTDAALQQAAAASVEKQFSDSPWEQAQSYADMEIAADVYKAIGEDRLDLVFQPVFNTGDLNSILYNECLTRIRVGEGDETLSPGQFIPSLERLGVMRCLDRYVMRRAIALLEEHDDACLGVNISGQSAIDDVWWASIFAKLAETPSVAQRLTIEITETARIYPGAGRQFCHRMHQLGCHIAIDDFGAGFAMENGLDLHAPDIIKIDASILKRGIRGGVYSSFGDIVGTARERAARVVVEGIESLEELEFVRGAGVLWGQGNYVAKPVTSLRV
ncbi:Cyclic di-GMP phosphodiesterase PdeF [Ralstonia psammae]|uniref:Cyclic di-GMP phosphodiesterase PdeF n=1 Tax=Ralstonia psammae TaxID=3058598 RepID=A0ABM9K1A7_9RALS|nr:EAL domain-containing protein [Ralstonia sp. LMG 19083]CAJ0809793.1 Cyclic di-GMP phosphodiesterase PdeF [Ralstonia sp. LMG 19083]